MSLQHAFEDYIASSSTDLKALVGDFNGNVTCQFVTSRDDETWVVSHDGLHVHIQPESAQRALASGWAFRWSNGVVLIPTIVGLLRTGVLALVQSDEQPTLRTIGASIAGSSYQANLGNLWGALHLLELQGWAQHLDRDSESRFFLTDLGKSVVAIIEENFSVFSDLVNDIGSLKHYHDLCHNRQTNPLAQERFLGFLALSNQNWGLPVGDGDNLQSLAARQLVNALDGLLIGTALVAMGMPVYQKQDNRLAVLAESVFSRFTDDHEWTDRSTLVENINSAFVDGVIDWMARRGFAEATSEKVRLTSAGKIQVKLTPPLAALGVSYLPSYEFIDELLIGNPDPCGIDNDTHVDRVMNVYGSSGAGSGPATDLINQKVVKRLFNDTPLEQQPAGIADIGCGDGTALKRLADYIITHTVRGKHLIDFPLVVVGADFNDAPLERTRETLSIYQDIPGVNILVVKADITQPDAYNSTVMASGINVTDHITGKTRPLQLDDLLHTFMFLIHNRRLNIKDQENAHAIISLAVNTTSRERLAYVMENYFQRTLPQNDSEALATVLDCFNMSFSDAQGLVEGKVAAADLIAFLTRWKPYARHGLMSLEGHSPAMYSDAEPIPDNDQAWMRCDRLPHPLNWGMHFQSRQFMMPFNEYMLALTLAGFAPFDGKIYGNIHPASIPSIDQLPQHRFFSIGCYVA